MPIYMDVHVVPGVKARDVAEAHTKDLIHQDEYGCKCMTYWIDEERETIFCLIEAPEKDAVADMHKASHGLIPSKIIEVSSKVVQSFLGRIYDPEQAEITDEGLKVFSEPALRTLLLTKTNDTVLLQFKFGKEKANELLTRQNNIIRKNIEQFGGSEAEQAGSGFIVSFTSASKAISCALGIQKGSLDKDAEDLGLKIAINTGEPVENSNKMFGTTIQRASYLCSIASSSQIAISSSVKDLIAKDYSKTNGNRYLSLTPQDEDLLQCLYTQLEENWHNPAFDIEEYCHSMAMSKSQLYRKAIALTGFSPNQLLKEFRLEKAKELLKKQRYPIAQITFESGFTDPSYFTKCFKKKYGLLPMTYVDLLQ